MIDLGNEIEILKDGEVIARIGQADEVEDKKELMKENYVLLSFNLDCYYCLDRGHTIRYEGEEYMIREEIPPEEINIQEYRYKPKFEGLDMLFLDIILFYPYSNQPEGEWDLTASPLYFLEAAIKNIHEQLGDTSWTIGKVECIEPIEMSFVDISVFDACTEVAKAAEGEWYADCKAKTLNLVKKHEYGTLVELEREVNLNDIKRSNENNSEYCTRMYAFGSTKNIPTNYRPANNGEPLDRVAPKRLRLPASTPGYIDAYPNMKTYEIVPKVIKFDEVFPQRTGTIISIRKVSKPGDDGKPFDIYYFKDSGVDFALKYILPGQTLMMAFQIPSKLAGRHFELKYHEGSKEYEIINNQDNPDIVIPNDILMPQEGDPFVLYNFDIAMVGEQYVPAAEEELLEVATEKLRQIVEDKATYSCPLALAACSDEDMKYDVGQRVRLKSTMFKKNYKDSRIYGYTKKLNDITYLIGDNSEYSNLGTISASVTANKKESDVNYTENKRKINVVNRTVKGLDYIRQALAMDTSIDGGLILSALLQLGIQVGDSFQAMAGINGLLQSPEDVFLWGGGSIDDAVQRKTPFGILADGSGWFAGDKISWEAVGDMLVTGKYQTAKSGERIEIDPETRSIKMIDDKENAIVNISFNKNDERHTALIRVNNYIDGAMTGSAILEGDKISLLNQMELEYFSVSLNSNKLDVKLNGLPTVNNDKLKPLYTDEKGNLVYKKEEAPD